ncbi:MAG: ABC transporter ATP-binding protein [Pirellulales bacterium]
MLEPLVELRTVSVKFQSQLAISSLSLLIPRSQRLAIMGPSGAGKSTLLRVLAGLQTVDSGKVFLRGQPIDSVPAAKRSIAMLTQDYALYPQLSVEENLLAGLQSQQLSREESRNRIDQVIGWFEIGPLLKRLPSQISGGQAQRVAFAKALVRKPNLLLLDEPLSQLDYSLRNQLLSIILLACESMSISVCWVTHDPREAFQVASRIVVLNNGLMEQDDSATAIYQSPKSKCVAELSSYWPVNFLPMNSTQADQLIALAPANVNCAGLRSEHLAVVKEAVVKEAVVNDVERCSNWPSWMMRVDRVVFLGFNQMIHGTVGDQMWTVVDRLAGIEVGQEVKIAMNPQQILWF